MRPKTAKNFIFISDGLVAAAGGPLTLSQTGALPDSPKQIWSDASGNQLRGNRCNPNGRRVTFHALAGFAGVFAADVPGYSPTDQK